MFVKDAMRYLVCGAFAVMLLGGCSKIVKEEPVTTLETQKTQEKTTEYKIRLINPQDYIDVLTESETEELKQIVDSYCQTEKGSDDVRNLQMCCRKEPYQKLLDQPDYTVKPGLAIVCEAEEFRDGYLEMVRYVSLIRTSYQEPWIVADDGIIEADFDPRPKDYVMALTETEIEDLKQFIQAYYKTEREYVTVQGLEICKENAQYQTLLDLTDGTMKPGCAIIFEVRGIRDGTEEVRHISLIRTSDAEPWEVKGEGL